MRLSSLFLALCTVGLAACGSSDESTVPGTNADEDPSEASSNGGGDNGTQSNGQASSGSGSNGSGNGSGSGSGSSGGDYCEQHEVRNQRATPDILVVLDRSLSMKDQGVNRWDPSSEAVQAVTAALDDQIRFGLMLFPGGGQPVTTPPVDCSTLPLLKRLACLRDQAAMQAQSGNPCSAGQVFVPVDSGTGEEIQSTLSGIQPQGGTPTAASLAAAHNILKSERGANPQYVLLVTDGAPNCSSASLPSGSFDRKALTDSVNELEKMAADGIKSYVIGYDTANNTTLATSLDAMAVAGGTGDDKHRAVEDGEGLQHVLEDLAGTAISCEFTLDEAAADPSFVLVEIDGKQINIDDADGFRLDAGSKKITVQGTACETLRDGTEHLLRVQILCEAVTPS